MLRRLVRRSTGANTSAATTRDQGLSCTRWCHLRSHPERHRPCLWCGGAHPISVLLPLRRRRRWRGDSCFQGREVLPTQDDGGFLRDPVRRRPGGAARERHRAGRLLRGRGGLGPPDSGRAGSGRGRGDPTARGGRSAVESLVLLAERREVQRRRHGELRRLRLGQGGSAWAGEHHHAPAAVAAGGGGAGGAGWAAAMVGGGGLAVGSVEVNGDELARVRHRRPRGA
uniref:Uncharacterized protein n=1 Tax=Arundo donax TaxID=35708 RepID=A0A0A9CN71_ARUDO